MKTVQWLLLLLPLLLAGCEKARLDEKVRELCANDGGIKVYEMVKLPAEKYNRLLDNFGRLRIPRQNEAKATDEYYDECEKHYYRQGNPEMSRNHCRIIRRSDGKVLGELVIYGRGGGDMPGPWHDSSFLCPEPANIQNFESSIFVKGE